MDEREVEGLRWKGCTREEREGDEGLEAKSSVEKGIRGRGNEKRDI